MGKPVVRKPKIQIESGNKRSTLPVRTFNVSDLSAEDYEAFIKGNDFNYFGASIVFEIRCKAYLLPANGQLFRIFEMKLTAKEEDGATASVNFRFRVSDLYLIGFYEKYEGLVWNEIRDREEDENLDFGNDCIGY